MSYPRTHAEAAPVPAPFPMPAITARGRRIDDEDMEKSVREKGYDVVCNIVHLPLLFSQVDSTLPVGIADRGITQTHTHI